MALGRLWAGQIFGTNTGKVFIKFETTTDGSALIGELRLNEPGTPLVIFRITGRFDGTSLRLEGTPETENPNVQLGRLHALGYLNPDGSVKGEWETSIGTAGTFILFPHSTGVPDTVAGVSYPFIAQHSFRPIQINRDQIIALAQDMQRGFPNGKLIVTITAGTTQSRLRTH